MPRVQSKNLFNFQPHGFIDHDILYKDHGITVFSINIVQYSLAQDFRPFAVGLLPFVAELLMQKVQTSWFEMATNQGDEEIGDEEEEGHDCEDNPRPELGLLGSVLLFDLHQVLGGGHDLRGGDHNGPNLDEEKLKKAEGAVVGDRVEPGIRHGDVSHLLTF